MSPNAPVVSDAPCSLSAAMRDGSQEAHDAAEGSSFVSELLGGAVNARGYLDYLLRLRMVYSELENALRAQRCDTLVSAVFDPALERQTALDSDIEYWSAGVPVTIDSPAARAYCERIATASGGALLAHHYTRYLGDLSGGQAIGRILNRVFELDGNGLSFYEFPMRAKPYKDAYRARLDALSLDSEEAKHVVDEVKVAFRLNQELFDELAKNLTAYAR